MSGHSQFLKSVTVHAPQGVVERFEPTDPQRRWQFVPNDTGGQVVVESTCNRIKASCFCVRLAGPERLSFFDGMG